MDIYYLYHCKNNFIASIVEIEFKILKYQNKINIIDNHCSMSNLQSTHYHILQFYGKNQVKEAHYYEFI